MIPSWCDSAMNSLVVIDKFFVIGGVASSFGVIDSYASLDGEMLEVSEKRMILGIMSVHLVGEFD